jgi:hypothetical protein
MFEQTSRYASIETATYTMPDGREVAYKRRRILPPGEALPLLAEVTVAQSDRLDLIASRTLGDSEQFWRVADANNAMHPLDLTEVVGRVLRIPLPQP